MLHKIEKYIDEQDLLKPDSTVIVGTSGGADSMALLDILRRLNYTCIAAHCNFHLRGSESNRDAAFVRNWCEQHKIEVTFTDFDTHKYAREHKVSIEMAARELRYRWFEAIREKYSAQAIAVAHHRDDSIETVLLNLIRGTGIKGLTGISPKNGYIVRPLLVVSHEEIRDYLRERDIPFVFDSTNADDAFLRNAIRLKIMPALETLNPAVKEAIQRTSYHLSETEKVYQHSLEQWTKDIFIDNKIAIEPMKKSPSPRSLLFHILSPLGFSPSDIEDVFESINAQPGKIFYANTGYRLTRDRDYFLLDKVQPQTSESVFYIDADCIEMTHPIHLKIEKISSDNAIVKDKSILYLDMDTISFPLVLRRWKPGDWFVPFGMNGRKKLSDYFTDRKFSVSDKENVWILVSGDDIVWIVGERSDNRFRVADTTRKMLVMHIIGEERHKK